jgi:hypothetical protein
MFQLRGVPLMSDVVVLYLSSTVALIPNGQFLVVPLLHSVSDLSDEFPMKNVLIQ